MEALEVDACSALLPACTPGSSGYPRLLLYGELPQDAVEGHKFLAHGESSIRVILNYAIAKVDVNVIV